MKNKPHGAAAQVDIFFAILYYHRKENSGTYAARGGCRKRFVNCIFLPSERVILLNIREQRIKLLIAAATNLVASVLVALTVGTFFVSGGEGNMTVKGAVCFVFFTVDSNVLAALGGLAAGIAEIVLLCRKQSGEAFLPKWLYIFKFAGACAVTVTFLTVVAFLGPTIGYASMFSGINFFLHFLCPLMFAETAVLFDPVPKDVKRITLICAGTLPVVIYGAVYY